MREILFAIKVIFPLGVADLADSRFRGDSLQLAVAVDLASEADGRMIGEDELEDVPPQAGELRGVGVDMEPGRQGRVARGDDPARAVLAQGDLDRADPAGAVGIELGRVAESRHVTAAEMAINEFQDRVAVLKSERFAIEVGS